MAENDLVTTLKFLGDPKSATKAIDSIIKESELAAAKIKKIFEGIGGDGKKPIVPPIKLPDTEKPRQNLLAYAQATARLEAAQGDLAKAAKTLKNALDSADKGTVEAVRAQTQLAGIQSRLASEAQKADKAILSEAAAAARLKQVSGDSAGAIKILSDALDKVGNKQSIEATRIAIQKTYLDTNYANSPLIGAIDRVDKGIKKNGDSIKILRESVETFSSELLENFLRIDGDIANTIGTMIAKLNLGTIAIAGLAAGFAAAGIGITAALFSMAKSAAELGEKLLDLSKDTGVSVEALSALRVVAERSGADINDLRNGLESLNEKLLDARDGNKELADLFRKLGVNIKGTTEEALTQIIKKFNQYEDGARKSKLAQDLFGEAGKDFLKISREMQGDIPKTIAKLRDMGLIMSQDAAEGAKKFNDQLKTLDNQIEGLKISIGTKFIPAFSGIIKIINDATAEIEAIIVKQDNLINRFTRLLALAAIASNPQLLATFVGAEFPGSSGRQPKRTSRIPKPGEVPTDEIPNLDGKDKGKKGLGQQRRDVQAQVRALQDLEKAAELANRRVNARLDAALQDRLISLEEFTAQAIKQEETLLRARLASLNEQERVALKNARTKAEKTQVFADFDLKRDQALLDAELSIEARRNELRRTIEKAEEDHQQRLFQIREIGRRSLSDQIEAQIREGARRAQVGADQLSQLLESQRRKLVDPVGLVEGRRQQIQLERQSFDERARLLQDELNRNIANLQERKRIQDEIRQLAEERAAFEKRASLEIIEAQEEESERVIRAIQNRIRARDEEIRGELERRINEGGPTSLSSRFGEEAAIRIVEMEQALGRQLTLWEQNREAMRLYSEGLQEAAEGAWTRAKDVLINFQAASTSAVDAFVKSGGSLKAAGKALAGALAAPFIEAAKTRAAWEFSEAIASLAIFDYRGFALHSLAGVGFAALAAIGTRLTQGGSGGGGATGAAIGGGAGSSAQSGPRRIEQGGPLPNRNEQPIIIQIRPEFKANLRNGVLEIVHDDINNNGETRRLIQANN